MDEGIILAMGAGCFSFQPSFWPVQTDISIILSAFEKIYQYSS